MPFSITRSVDYAREAYKKKDVAATIAAHRRPGHHIEEHLGGKYIKSVVYGGLDGIITTYAVVAGVTGASLSTGVLLILGFANLFADGVSMAFGDFLSTRAENEYHEAERRREEWEMDNYPEGEKKEMAEIYIQRGLSKGNAERVVELLSKNKKTFVDIMMLEELGIVESDESPLKNAFVTLFSFILFGFIPLLTYVIGHFSAAAADNEFIVATTLTGMALFTLGALKVKVTEKNVVISGIEMLVLGGVAAGIAYGIGYSLAGLA